MDRTHETLLLDTLRDVYLFGAGRLPYRLLYRWYDADRLTKRVWTGLLAHWQTVLEEKHDESGWRLGFIKNNRSDEITLICLDPEGVEESYLTPIKDLI